MYESDDTYFRDRIAELEDQLESLDNPSEGSISLLVQTVKETTYPTTSAKFFAVQPLSVDGQVKEGASASFTIDTTRTIYAFNVGGSIPPSGTKLIVTSLGGRWVFRYDGTE